MDRQDTLSAEGRQQMTHLAEQLAPYLSGTKLRFLGSPAHFIVESAYFLLNALKKHNVAIEQVEPFYELYTVGDALPDFAPILDMIQKKSEGVDTMIVMAHSLVARNLPTEYGRHIFRARIVPYELTPGQACIIHCEAKTTTIVR